MQIAVSFLPEVAFPYYAAKVQLMVPGMQEVGWTMQVCAVDQLCVSSPSMCVLNHNIL